MTNPDDESFDAETTSVADADWLADLRAQAEDSGRSMADLLANDRSDGPPPDETSLDTETTITDPSALDAVRSIIDDEKHQREAPEAEPSAAPSTDTPDAQHTGAARPRPADPGALPKSTARAASSGAEPNKSDQRWVAPPRLAADESAHGKPTGIGASQENASTSKMPVVAAVAVGLAVGFLIAFLVFGRNNTDNQTDVDDTTVDTANATIDGTTEGTSP